MLEKRKEESDSIQKYTNMLIGAVLGALILFLAPIIVGYVTGVDNVMSPPKDANLPDEITEKITSMFSVVLWIAQIAIVFAIMLAVIMLKLEVQINNTFPAGGPAGK